MTYVIGTRGSQLALKQTELVIERLNTLFPNEDFQVQKIVTEGDRNQKDPLVSFGGSGLFTSEIQKRILSGEIDGAVHSAKDLPSAPVPGLSLHVLVPRGDPRDILLVKGEKKLKELSECATGSPRRRHQILAKNSKLNFVECRGNITTRVQDLKDGKYESMILAVAGLERLRGVSSEGLTYKIFDMYDIVPAGGQGVIVLETRADSELAKMFSRYEDLQVRSSLGIERSILRILNLGCHEPVGIHVSPRSGFRKMYFYWAKDNVKSHDVKTYLNSIKTDDLELIQDFFKAIDYEIPSDAWEKELEYRKLGLL